MPNPSPTDQVMVLLDRRKVEALAKASCVTGAIQAEWLRAAQADLRSALSQEVEEVVEHMVRWEHGFWGPVTLPAEEVRRLWRGERPGENLRFLTRTTYSYKDGSQFVTAWSDLEEAA